MLTSLGLRNFKSWKELDIKFAPITAIFGTNSSGKSSIIQALLLMKQTVESPDPKVVLNLGGDERSLIDLGSFSDVIHEKSSQSMLGLDLKWSTFFDLPDLTDENPDTNVTPLRWDHAFECQIGEGKSGQIRIEKLGYSNSNRGISVFASNDSEDRYRIDVWDRTPPLRDEREPLLDEGREPPTFWRLTETQRAELASLSGAPMFEYDFYRAMGSIYYLGPLREPPKRTYQWSGSAPSHVGIAGEQTVSALLSPRAQHKEGAEEHTIAELLAYWLKRLSLVDTFEVRPIAAGEKVFRAIIRQSSASKEVLLPDVGFGISQVLPVIVQCLYVPSGSTVILEQPELHLHPKAQTELADFFIYVAKKRGVQLIIESHSEHLLQRLQRRLAEASDVDGIPAVFPDDVALYFTRIGAGGSTLDELRLDEFGNIKNWPKDFFGDPMGEVAAMVKATRARKERGK
ncbi:DUF3696 domain-containing protein [bacterium]|nr:DUF3696 domain-containing protein [bacterium]